MHLLLRSFFQDRESRPTLSAPTAVSSCLKKLHNNPVPLRLAALLSVFHTVDRWSWHLHGGRNIDRLQLWQGGALRAELQRQGQQQQLKTRLLEPTTSRRTRYLQRSRQNPSMLLSRIAVLYARLPSTTTRNITSREHLACLRTTALTSFLLD